MNVTTELSGPEKIIATVFHQLESQINGERNSGFHQVREMAYQKFQELGFPGIKHEEYRYTPLVKRVPPILTLPSDQTENADTGFLVKNLPEHSKSKKAVIVNGVLNEELSDLKNSPEKVSVNSFRKIIQRNPGYLESVLKGELEQNKDPFLSLNTAFAKDGIVVEIQDHVILESPFYIINFADTAVPGLFSSTRNIIIGKKNSRSQIVEFYLGKNQPTSFENCCTSIYLEENAELSYSKVQLIGNQAVQIDTTQVHQRRHSHFNSFTFTLSGGMIRNNLNVSLDEPECETHLYGLFLPTGKEHVDHHTVVDHRKPNCLSNEYYKGILDGESRGVFNGKIFVRPDAQKTNAYQSNKNILISEHASINTKPQLEIWADDVKCTHGTSTGKLDEDQLFYLRSRGIDLESARSLLVFAFVNEIIGKLDQPELRQYLEKKIQERLGQHF